MKKSLIALLMMATFALTFTACKKDKDEDEKKPETTENTWTIDGKKFELATSLVKPSFNGKDLAAIGSESILTISFSEKPAANGSYSVKSPGTELGANSCTVLVLNDKTAYYSTGKSNDVVTVTMVDGKVRAEINKIEIETTDGEKTSKASLSANILEN
ncbi:MAG TPA: hypothetical protein VLZ75_07170 [Chitinophagales bacterium]|nr:hypothetical protein [Chitinophagales bacterium]